MSNNDTLQTNLCYTLPPNVSPQYVIGIFGYICNGLSVINNLPANMTLTDLPDTVILEDKMKFRSDIESFMVILNQWSATYRQISCTGNLIGNQLNLFFTLSGVLPENVIIE